MKSDLKTLPSVSEVLDNIKGGKMQHIRYITNLIRTEIEGFRKQIRSGSIDKSRSQITGEIVAKIEKLLQSSVRNVMNGTGIVLHTGFGRAPISGKILEDSIFRLEGYTNLELDLETGKRSDRNVHIQDYLSAFCDTESAAVVNNNAAAVLLSINTFGYRKEVIVSRGQLVEIGGLFRIPDIIQKSEGIIKEVGSTNRTHLSDYEKAISEHTGIILWVHTSNYRVRGFTSEVPLSDLANLGKKHGIPVIADLGSGALIQFDFNGSEEKPVEEIIKSGVDLVTFSGDKLLGGPQSGIIAGRKELINRIKNNPVYRAVRCDKVTITLLEQTLRSYKREGVGNGNLTHFLLSRNRKQLDKVARQIMEGLDRKEKDFLGLEVVESLVEAGSGSMPVESMESLAFRFDCDTVSSHQLAKQFRLNSPPVVGYIRDDVFFIDLKALIPGQESDLVKAIKQVTGLLF